MNEFYNLKKWKFDTWNKHSKYSNQILNISEFTWVPYVNELFSVLTYWVCSC